MKGKNTIQNKPSRYGGILHQYEKDLYELTGEKKKCWCCGADMVSHIKNHKVKPYTARFKISKGKYKGISRFHILCRACAYRYGRGVIECDGKTYCEPDEFCEDKWLEENGL